jgi:hypothetical protein
MISILFDYKISGAPYKGFIYDPVADCIFNEYHFSILEDFKYHIE